VRPYFLISEKKSMFGSFPRTGVACLGAVALALQLSSALAQPPTASSRGVKTGLTVNDPRAFRGYSLIAPMNSTTTYLVDMDGLVVRSWKSEYSPAMSAYLLENGHLLRPGAARGGFGGRGGGGFGGRGGGGFGGPGSGGRIQEFDWDGTLLWDYSLSTEKNHPHHDICPMPNGNVLVIAWDKKTSAEAIAAGRHPRGVQGELLPDCILEVHPTGKTTGDIVWQWHAWDHLIQDIDKTKANYGEVSEHPELIDVNYGTGFMASLLNDPKSLATLRSLGYVGGGGPSPTGGTGASNRGAAPAQQAGGAGDSSRGRGGPGDSGRGRGGPGMFGGPGGESDMMHTNAVDYNANLDQIMVSVHNFSEVWIIDHSTTTAQAATHSGGRYGKGGDLLYRWGNPRAYRSGTNADQRLFAQHCAKWIPKGRPGEGHLLVFNNGGGRNDGTYSSVDEVVLPVEKDGRYAREEFAAFGPERAAWSYAAPNKSSFYAMNISGAQRLPNGDTFICNGIAGVFFEVTANKDIVWNYSMPGGGMGGPGGMFGRGGGGGNMFGGMFGPFGFGQPGIGPPDGTQADAPPAAVATNTPDAKKPSSDQGRTQDRADRSKPAASGSDRGGPDGNQARAGQPGGFDGRGGFGGRGGGRGGRGGGRGGPGGPGGMGGIFTCYRYAPDYAGLVGKDLTPGKKLEDFIAQ